MRNMQPVQVEGCGMRRQRQTTRLADALEPVAVVYWSDIGHHPWRSNVMLPDGTALRRPPDQSSASPRWRRRGSQAIWTAGTSTASGRACGVVQPGECSLCGPQTVAELRPKEQRGRSTKGPRSVAKPLGRIVSATTMVAMAPAGLRGGAGGDRWRLPAAVDQRPLRRGGTTDEHHTTAPRDHQLDVAHGAARHHHANQRKWIRPWLLGTSGCWPSRWSADCDRPPLQDAALYAVALVCWSSG